MAWRFCLGGRAFMRDAERVVGNESIADATPQSVSAQLIKGKTTQQNVRIWHSKYREAPIRMAS
jgi:hypothetical protein